VFFKALVTGNSFRSIAFNFRLGETTVSRIIKKKNVQTHTRNCDAEISFKNYKRTLGKAADDFMHKWQMLNCLGALDGKHISIFATQKSGSLYHNYKGNYSLVL
jgi:hypothetical protein